MCAKYEDPEVRWKNEVGNKVLMPGAKPFVKDNCNLQAS